MKFLIYSSLIIFLFTACSSSQNSENNDPELKKNIEIHGNTQGTKYTILCNDTLEISRKEVDSVLHQFDLALNTYINISQITKLNNAEAGSIKISDPHGFFRNCYNDAYQMYLKSNGAFDPTVGPLVSAWGFKDNSFTHIDSTTVDSILLYTSFQKGKVFQLIDKSDSLHFYDTITVVKKHSLAQLDFNAIAQGYSVDVIHDYLKSKGGENFFIEIGGEVRVSGTNAENEAWRIGVDKPSEDNDGQGERQMAPNIFHLNNKAIATSGNYRKFYKEKGVTFVHTLNPKSGYPITHKLLSATVVAENASVADALATVFMVVGQDKGMDILRKLGNKVDGVYLIYINEKGETKEFISPNIKRMIF